MQVEVGQTVKCEVPGEYVKHMQVVGKVTKVYPNGGLKIKTALGQSFLVRPEDVKVTVQNAP